MNHHYEVVVHDNQCKTYCRNILFSSRIITSNFNSVPLFPITLVAVLKYKTQLIIHIPPTVVYSLRFGNSYNEQMFGCGSYIQGKDSNSNDC